MSTRVMRFYYVSVYYLSWLAFGVVGLALNLACMPLLLLPRRSARGPAVRAAIRWCFDLWLRWFHATGLVRVSFEGFHGPLAKRTVYIANHPSLLDATFLLARLPDAICIFKPALLRNPAIGPAAIMGGYAAATSGIELVRDASGKVAAGQSLLIFPEGTRTGLHAPLGRLKPGFALIAERARAPVQLIIVRAPRDLLARGRPWWRPPAQLPTFVRFELDRCWNHDPSRTAGELTAEVERHMRAVLTGRSTPPVSAPPEYSEVGLNR